MQMRCSSHLSLMTLGVAFLVLAAVVARVAQPHVQLPAFAIWCDGIDDEDSGSFWGMPQTKKDEAKSPLKMRMRTIRIESQVASGRARTSDQRDEISRPILLLFRPRLFSARAVGRSDTATPD